MKNILKETRQLLLHIFVRDECTKCGDVLQWLPVRGFDKTEKLICGACGKVHGYREKESKKVTARFFDE